MATGNITNRLLDPSGTALVGVTISARLMPNPSGFRSVTFYEISQLETTTTDANGDWLLTLEQNATIQPGDTYWEIIEDIPVSAGTQRTWAVQVAAGTNTLYASLVSTPPGTSVPSYITQSSGDARYMPYGALTIGSVQAVGTATATGTATTAAASNHVHPLNPSVIGSGLTLVSGVVNVTPARTATNTVNLALGQLSYNSNSAVVNLMNGSNLVVITPVAAVYAATFTTTNVAYVTPTAGPSVTIFTGTKALVTVGGTLFGSTGGMVCYLSYAVSGATTIAAADTVALTTTQYTANPPFQGSYTSYQTGLVPGLNTFTVQVKGDGSNTLTTRNIVLRVEPLP